MTRSASLLARLRLPPYWVVFVAVAADAAAAAWRAASNSAAPEPGFFLRGLVWPGLAVLAAVYAFAWLGWALEID